MLQFCFRFLANENSMNWTLESPNRSCTSSRHIIFAAGDEVAEGQVAHCPHQSQVWMSQECCWCQVVCAWGLGGPHVPTSPAGVWHMKDARPFCRHTPPPKTQGIKGVVFPGTSQCCEGREGLGPTAGQWGLYLASSPPPWGGGGGVLTLCFQRCWVWLQETKESFVLGEKPLFQT